MMIPTAAHKVIQSRLLVLQGKRLMLSTCERRLDQHGTEALRRRVDRLRLETSEASHLYMTSVLQWGTADTSEYWVVAYARLIEMGQALTTKLRHAACELELHERYHVSADVEALEEILDDWSGRMRRSMSKAVA